jgi:thiol-disulfide isomerase/thioredoxin
MSVEQIEFTKLEKQITSKGGSVQNCLAPDIGRVYIISVTRDGCPACKKQKPKTEKLAKRIAQEYGNKVVFVRIHVKHSPKNNEESLRSKDLLGHYFYPTNIVLLKTRDRGAVEYYRNVSPRMSELERSIKAAVELADMLEKDAA